MTETLSLADDPILDAPPSGGEARAYALGQEAARASDKLPALERMGEKVARSLKDAIEPLARARAQVPAPRMALSSFGEWQAALPFFTSLSHYRLRPLKGGMLIAIDPGFVTALVESFYGGGSRATRPHKAADFTQSEELLLKRLVDKLVEILALHWRDLTPVEPVLAARETNIAHVGFLRPADSVAVQTFEIAAGPMRGEIAIVYPLAMLRPIEARLASKVHDDDDAGSTDDWRRRLGAALSQVSLPVRSVLARPEISVAALLALKPGDVIPINLPPRTPLLAGRHRIAEGVIGEQDGRAALMIERVGDE